MPNDQRLFDRLEDVPHRAAVGRAYYWRRARHRKHGLGRDHHCRYDLDIAGVSASRAGDRKLEELRYGSAILEPAAPDAGSAPRQHRRLPCRRLRTSLLYFECTARQARGHRPGNQFHYTGRECTRHDRTEYFRQIVARACRGGSLAGVSRVGAYRWSRARSVGRGLAWTPCRLPAAGCRAFCRLCCRKYCALSQGCDGGGNYLSSPQRLSRGCRRATKRK